jgi:hypothetical protein
MDFQAFNQYVPSEWLKLTFIGRPTLDAANNNTDDSHFWIHSISYDSDISKLRKVVPNG